jgi:hypothetical protein
LKITNFIQKFEIFRTKLEPRAQNQTFTFKKSLPAKTLEGLILLKNLQLLDNGSNTA